jgi:hypothetical protein
MPTRIEGLRDAAAELRLGEAITKARGKPGEMVKVRILGKDGEIAREDLERLRDRAAEDKEIHCVAADDDPDRIVIGFARDYRARPAEPVKER